VSPKSSTSLPVAAVQGSDESERFRPHLVDLRVDPALLGILTTARRDIT
jgi:hypothetical protein